MAVEIERLYDECHNWRVKYDRQLEQMVDRNHYEQIINEQNDRIIQLEARLTEIPRLQHDVEEWRQRYEYLLKEKEEEIGAYLRRCREYEEELQGYRLYREKYE
jgi:hypothetical protein